MSLPADLGEYAASEFDFDPPTILSGSSSNGARITAIEAALVALGLCEQ